ncbi:EAL domain-containing protein [Rahnella aquatilis]|nr:EAL domain-containing protein [Rahnella aquatilis]
MSNTDRLGISRRMITLFARGLRGLLQPVLTRRLRRAIVRGDIRPWYQPVVTGARGEVTGCEVLARMVGPGGRVIGPGQFIPLAERSGLIVPLTRVLMRRARRELASIAAYLPPGFEVSVNLSAAHAGSTIFVRDCRLLQRALRHRDVRVCAEVTERQAFAAVAGGRTLLVALRAAGVKVMLDDFATGYQGMQELDALPVDGVKIDRHHVRALSRPQAVPTAEMIIRLGRLMALDVVAEGVETRAQHAWLLDRGVTRQQGYYFSRPVPADGLVVCLIVGCLR